jgi:hypothetical protein
MHQPSEAIQRFFRAFEANTASNDIEAQVAQFADIFLAAGPQGAQAVRATDFALALPRRKRLFDRMGCRSTQLLSLNEEPLDARYVLARTKWKLMFERPGITPQDLVVESVYIVDTGGEAGTAADARIVFYLANQDIMQIVKERGLLPA